MTNIVIVKAKKNLDVIEVRRFTSLTHFDIFKKTHDIKRYITLNDDLKTRDKIVIARAKKSVKKCSYARFESISEMRDFVSKNDLHFATSKATKREDKRFLLSKDNKISYKVFVFNNDVHYVDNKYYENRFVKSDYFDDFIASTI